MTVSKNDRAIIRDLATRYMALCESDRNKQLKEEWRRLNNMQPCRPMIYANDGLISQEIKPHLPERQVQDDDLAGAEIRLQWALSWGASVGDDRVFDPWFGLHAQMSGNAQGLWGIGAKTVRDESSRGWRSLPVLKTMDDLKQLRKTEHRVIDPFPPRVRKIEDVIGDILPVNVSRAPVYSQPWGGMDLSQQAGGLFGLEELLFALYTDPDMVHEFMAFTRDGVLESFRQAEAAGDWSTTNSWYYKTPTYCDDLPDPAPNSYGAKMKDLARFSHCQEFEGVSPDMFEEFCFNYQLPIMELFGRMTYGCCETLDTKLDVLKRMTNLTKILSGPRSDPACYPEPFGEKCVISWRPVSAIIAAERFDEAAQRRQLREGVAKLKGCNFEIHMHEPMTVHGDLDRVKRWVQIAREESKCLQ